MNGQPSAAIPAMRRADDLAHDPLRHGGIENGCGRVGAHAAGVRALIAVEGALVVLGGADLQRMGAVAQGEQAGLLADQAFLDDQRPAARIDGRQGLLDGGGDDNTLAGGQAVGLDDDGSTSLRVYRPGAALGIGEGGVAGCRYGVAAAEILGEGLRAFEPGRSRGWAERADTGLGQPVDEAEHQRQFGTDDDEAYVLAPRQRHDAVQVVHGHRHAAAPRLRSRHCRGRRGSR